LLNGTVKGKNDIRDGKYFKVIWLVLRIVIGNGDAYEL